MFIEKYQYRNTKESTGWAFDELSLGKTNLLVGKSGCGKTRLLTTIFNLASTIASNKTTVHNGLWELTYRNDNSKFKYALQLKEGLVVSERLEHFESESFIEVIKRTQEELIYKDTKLPQLNFERPAINLLKEEDSVKSAFNAFKLVCRRRFDDDALASARTVSNIPQTLLEKFEISGFNALEIFDLPLPSRLFLIESINKSLHQKIKEKFLDVFPEFTGWQIRKLKASEMKSEVSRVVPDGIMPQLFLSEKNVSGQISLDGLSSGMQKVLLIITDVLSAPKGTVYLVDEYENSLGVNAIDFLPDLLNLNTDIQTLITTHHPYLINAMPIENWQILSRKGSSVSITRGDQRKELYESSAQEAFIKLLNDPLYSN